MATSDHTENVTAGKDWPTWSFRLSPEYREGGTLMSARNNSPMWGVSHTLADYSTEDQICILKARHFGCHQNRNVHFAKNTELMLLDYGESQGELGDDNSNHTTPVVITHVS